MGRGRGRLRQGSAMHFIEDLRSCQTTVRLPRSLGSPAQHRGTCRWAGEGWALPELLHQWSEQRQTGTLGRGKA